MNLQIEEVQVPDVDSIPDNPLEILDTEPQAVASEASHDNKETSSETPPTINEIPAPAPKEVKTIPSFIGTIQVKFPETNEEWTFTPLETQRGRGWSYPSPLPSIKTEDKMATLCKLLGGVAVIDLIEDSLNRNCQAKWKQAVEDIGESKPVADIATHFASIFYEGKTREASTPEGLFKKAGAYQREAMKEKELAGGKITDKVKELSALAREYATRANELQMKALEEMGG